MTIKTWVVVPYHQHAPLEYWPDPAGVADSWQALAAVLESPDIGLLVPAPWIGTYVTKIPKLTRHQQHQAALFSVEEQLAEPLENLQAISVPYSDNQILVRVINKKLLADLLAKVKAAGLNPLGLYSAADCLAPVQQTTLWDFVDYIVIAEPGQPTQAIAANLLPALGLTDHALTPVADYQLTMIKPAYNLLPTAPYQQPYKLWLLAGITAGVFFMTQGIEALYLHRQLNQANQQIKIIYQRLFPEATAVIAPKLRAQRLLQDNQGNRALLDLLDKFGAATQGLDLDLQAITYQNQQLTLKFAQPFTHQLNLKFTPGSQPNEIILGR